MTYSPTIPKHDLPQGAMRRVVVDGVPVCLFHLSDGILATQDTCTHQRASLAAGKLLDDGTVECPRHGSRFDVRTGQPKSFPATQSLQRFATKVEDGMIYVALQQPT